MNDQITLAGRIAQAEELLASIKAELTSNLADAQTTEFWKGKLGEACGEIERLKTLCCAQVSELTARNAELESNLQSRLVAWRDHQQCGIEFSRARDAFAAQLDQTHAFADQLERAHSKVMSLEEIVAKQSQRLTEQQATITESGVHITKLNFDLTRESLKVKTLEDSLAEKKTLCCAKDAELVKLKTTTRPDYWGTRTAKQDEIERLKELCREKDEELNEAASAHECELDQFKRAQFVNETELSKKAKHIMELEAKVDYWTHHVGGKDAAISGYKVEVEKKCQLLRDKDKELNTREHTIIELEKKAADRDGELKAAIDALESGTSKLGLMLKEEQTKNADLMKMLEDAKRTQRPNPPELRDVFGVKGTHYGAKVLPIFWRSEDYHSFMQATADGAVYSGECVDGWSALIDVMLNVGRACDCVAHGSGDTLRARIAVGGFDYDVDRHGNAV